VTRFLHRELLVKEQLMDRAPSLETGTPLLFIFAAWWVGGL